MKEGFAEARQIVWRRAGLVKGTDPVVLDLDASLVEVHSEHKEGTGSTFKGGFGFHPMFCFCDATGEALSALLRPGNATANDAADHLTVLDEAIAQLPERVAVGHRDGDDPSLVRRPLIARADSAGASHDFVWGCRARNVGFSVVARKNAQIHGAISQIADDERRWQPRPAPRRAKAQGGGRGRGDRPGRSLEMAAGDTPHHPARAASPRGPESLFPSLEFRYWGHYTDQRGQPVERDVFMRAHAHVEDNIERLKGSGFCASPSATSTPTVRGSPKCASPLTSCAGSRSSVSTASSPRPSPRRFAGACGTPRRAWCVQAGARSCESSRAGPTQTLLSGHTVVSCSSPEAPTSSEMLLTIVRARPLTSWRALLRSQLANEVPDPPSTAVDATLNRSNNPVFSGRDQVRRCFVNDRS